MKIEDKKITFTQLQEAAREVFNRPDALNNERILKMKVFVKDEVAAKKHMEVFNKLFEEEINRQFNLLMNEYPGNIIPKEFLSEEAFKLQEENIQEFLNSRH